MSAAKQYLEPLTPHNAAVLFCRPGPLGLTAFKHVLFRGLR